MSHARVMVSRQLLPRLDLSTWTCYALFDEQTERITINDSFLCIMVLRLLRVWYDCVSQFLLYILTRKWFGWLKGMAEHA